MSYYSLSNQFYATHLLITRMNATSGWNFFIFVSRSEAQSARNAKSWPQPIPYLPPIPLPLCDMVLIFPLPSPRVGSEGRFYSRSLVLCRARETVGRVLPASEETHIKIRFWLIFQIVFRRSACWLGKDAGCWRLRTIGVGMVATHPNGLFIYFIILLACTR
jgi:hypothetical protein